MPEALRVLIVDDHSLFRNGLRTVLESNDGIEVVGEAEDGQAAIKQALACCPDIILMDINMPKCNGLEATREIKRLLPKTKIVILTVSDADNDLFEAIKNGADGYLLKDIKEQELATLLKLTIKGEAFLQGMLAAKILEEFRRLGEKEEAKSNHQITLSEREQEVLKLIAVGTNNRQIAKQLCISENTVKHHISNIMSKLHVQNRIQLAVLANEGKK
jgi:DNA-binding NarL/FixJ family response regulator